MTADQQRIKIAEACGWEPCGWRPIHSNHKPTDLALGGTEDWWRNADENTVARLQELPDYLTDLNAMHEAIQMLTLLQLHQYVEILKKSDGPVSRDHCPVTWIYAHVATAEQRAEAFLRTLELWEEL